METYPTWPNLAAMMFARAREWPDKPMLRAHRGASWQSITWGEFARRAASVARHLRAVGVAGDARRRASRRAAALTRPAPVLLKSRPAAAPVTGTILDLTHKGRVVVHLLAPSRGTTRHRELTSETADSAVNGSDVSVGASDFGSRSTESWHTHSPSLAEPPHGQ